MKFKNILLGLFLHQTFSVAEDAAQKYTVYWTNLNSYANAARACIALEKRGRLVSAKEKQACETTYKMYLTMLTEYYDFLAKGKK